MLDTQYQVLSACFDPVHVTSIARCSLMGTRAEAMSIERNDATQGSRTPRTKPVNELSL